MRIQRCRRHPCRHRQSLRPVATRRRKTKSTTQTATGEVATSISGDSADKRGMALVRVVNAAPTENSADRACRAEHALTEAGFKKVTNYQPIDRNWVTFEIGTSSRQRV